MNKYEDQKKIAHHKITLPKGGGAISGIGEKFQANAVTGTGTFSVPIPLTPSRGGFQPTLSLTYDSGSGNGIFGLGWSLDIPNISRKTAQGLPRYLDGAESDTFLLSGAEDLVPLLNADGTRPAPETKVEDAVTYSVTLYRPRVEGLFARIERWKQTSALGAGDVHWRATTRDNLTSIYGKSPSSRVADPSDTSRVFKWLIERSQDAIGNVIQYIYKAEDQANVTMTPAERSRERLGSFGANRHLARISYGYKASPGGATDFHFHVVFDYDDHPDDPTTDAPTFATTATWPSRQDPFSDHRAGFEIRTYRLCRRIVMFHEFDELDEAAPVPVRCLELAYTEDPVATKLTSVRQKGFKQRPDGTYENKAFPAVAYSYSEAVIDTEVRRLDARSLENLPQGLGGPYQWIDLDGEGLSGILAEQGGAWYYKRNEGAGRFGPLKLLHQKPVAPPLSNRSQLVDVDGDGNTELVINTPSLAGFYSYADGAWESFRAFSQRLNIDFDDPRIKQIDLTGDGRPDLLIAEDNVFTWHESLARNGYSAARKVHHPLDESDGPKLVFAEPVQTIFLADMTGDGLTDIVRIRAGSVCYWPNLGYGKFGPKVIMDNAPRLDAPDLFNPRYVKLGDVDGSGTTDLFYFGGKRPKFWRNLAGNGYDDGHDLPALPVDSLSSVDIIDLFGKGTSCVVWSTQLPNKGAQQMSYVDLMSAVKPHLLTQIDNGMGKAVEIEYAPSTEDYLRDRNAGTPWITKLPFPVHVLRKVTTIDLVGGTRLDTRYRYHHGYYDGPEREFRGFGMVETLDTEIFEKYEDTDQGEHYVTPVLTKTWFHNGAFLKQKTISARYAEEYFKGVDLDHPDVLPDTWIEDEDDLTAEETREAYRALKGRTLRQEVWEADPETGLAVGTAPYSTAESNFTVNRLQPKGDQKHAVFRADTRETITWHYEQNASDPRIVHDLTLEVDDYGNVLKSGSVVYRRRTSTPFTEQLEFHATCAVSTPIKVDPRFGGAFYLIGAPCEAMSFEVGGITAPSSGYLSLDAVKTAVDTALEYIIPFDQHLSGGAQARRLSWQRTLYWNAAQSAALPAGQTTEKALLHHVETAVLSSGLVSQAFGSSLSDTDFISAGYKRLSTSEDPQQHWWNPGLTQYYSIGGFYLPIRTEDPFANSVTVTYDTYSIAPVQVVDALTNTSTAEIDYRTLSPWKLTDPNQDSAEAITDPLGMVIATSIYGTEVSGPRGDTPLSSYTVVEPPNLRHVIDNPHTYLQGATTFFYYDLDAWTDRDEPPQAVGLSREKHVSDLGPGELPDVQKTVSYSDGFGRAIQTKIWSEPGEAWVRQPDGSYVEQDVTERWLASGRTVYNNKQKPVKQYEPFYSATSSYEPEEFFAIYGVTPIIHYDPLLRVIRTDLPMMRRIEEGNELVTYHVHSMVEFTPWEVTTHDANDTVLESEYYAQYSTLTPAEQAALDKAAAHAHTPSTAHLDTLARQFRTVQRLAPTTELATVTVFDITGKPLKVRDPRQVEKGVTGVDAFQYVYDMPGATLRTQSIDAGDDRVFANVMSNPVKSFDAKGHVITAAYDVLHRPVKKTVNGDGLNNVVERLAYGEGVEGDTDKNLRGRLYQHYDQAGRMRIPYYDLHGQIGRTQRRIRTAYKTEANWPDSGGWNAQLDAETFQTTFTYDALSRLEQVVHPDDSKVRPLYHQSGRLRRIRVMAAGQTTWSNYVVNIKYNAKSQREQIVYGNSTRTDYKYDDATFRLERLRTKRTGDDVVLQLINYLYDPVGNIVRITDDSHEKVFGTTGPVSPVQNYTYDALYRLTRATGRMHNSLGQNDYKTQAEFKANAHLNDITQMSEYTRTYQYDSAGNLNRLRQTGTNPFNRYIKIAVDSSKAVLNIVPGSTDIEATPAEIAEYFDANGNQKKLDHLAGVTWTYRDSIASATIIERADPTPDDVEYYVYDAAGQRVRKVKETWGSGVVTIEEKIYVGNVEVKRRRQQGQPNTLERWSLHVMDDKQRIALVHRWTNDATGGEAGNVVDPAVPASYVTKLRYQYGNHLGSASLELDGTGQIVSYEEFFPYGETSFMFGPNQIDVKLKEYRFTGKERDDSTSLYYYGQRYYAPWLCRWLSADPAGPVDGINLFQYVSCNPISFIDKDGRHELSSDIVETTTQASNASDDTTVSIEFQNDVAVIEPNWATIDSVPPETLPTSDKALSNVIAVSASQRFASSDKATLQIDVGLYNDLITPQPTDEVEDPSGQFHGEYVYPSGPFAGMVHGRIQVTSVQEVSQSGGVEVNARMGSSAEVGIDAPKAIGQTEQRFWHKNVSQSPKTTLPGTTEVYAAAGAVTGVELSSTEGPVTQSAQVGVVAEVGTHGRSVGVYASVSSTLDLPGDTSIFVEQTFIAQSLESRLFSEEPGFQSGGRAILQTTVGVRTGAVELSVSSTTETQDINPTLNQHRTGLQLSVSF